MRENRTDLNTRWARRSDEREGLPCEDKFTFKTKQLAEEYVRRSGKATCVYACQQLTCLGDWHVSQWTPEQVEQFEMDQAEERYRRAVELQERNRRAEERAQDELNDADRMTYRRR